ncbi:MAG TPA: imidazolonepropionase [Bdellovibrionales bacterium]|nr:imidazolonepropionase [Bdellovibrionales bacterium]
MALTKVFKDIDELLTLEGAAKKGGRRVTEDDLGLVRRGALVVSGKRIAWAGSMSDLPRAYRRAPQVSLKGKSVVPAFLECHTHLVFAGNRADEFEKRNQGMSYQEIAQQGGGILSTMRATREASVAELAKLGQKRAELFVRQGVTTIEAKSGYGLNTESELKILAANQKIKGARIVSTYLGPHAVPSEFKSPDEYVRNIIAEALPALKKKKLAGRCDIFVEKGFFLDEAARAYLRAAKDVGFDVVVHADQLSLSGGARMAIEFGARSADHLLQIEKPEVEALAKSDVTCVLLPASDLYLKTKYPPARALIDAGARVALATDYNPGSSPTQDLALVGLLARLEMKMTLPEVIGAYTVGAAHALGLEKQLGSLQKGRLADFVVLDGGWRDLFYQIGHMPVAQVWREGKRAFA